MAKKKTADTPEELTLDYQLAELPSSQHRAGLAGLVLMVNWVKRQRTNKGKCYLTRLDRSGATLKIDREGLEALFDEVYGAFKQEREDNKKRSAGSQAPTSEQDRPAQDHSNDGENALSTDRVVPMGAFLLDFDPTATGRDGIWIKLWREMLFGTLRGRDRQRISFKDRAEGRHPTDSAKSWDVLSLHPERSVKMPSTYYAGAQDNNAEDVPFQDRARYQFLLHFWPYVAQTYVPSVIDDDGKQNYLGYALAIPDIADLEWFCEELPSILKSRTVELAGYRPRGSLVDLAVEGALDILARLQERLSVLEGDKATSDAVLGVDVIHFVREKRNVNIKGSFRIDPEPTMIDEYSTLRRTLWNSVFRKQRLLNLVNRCHWYAGFDALLTEVPQKELFSDDSRRFKYFRHDVRESFRQSDSEGEDMDEQTRVSGTSRDDSIDVSLSEIGYETLIYKLVGIYLTRKLKDRYQLEWNSVKGAPESEADYTEKRKKLARDAFLAVRSRYDQDFIDYFASTLCSVSQNMSEKNFVAFSQALFQDTDRIRALTMLALSARG